MKIKTVNKLKIIDKKEGHRYYIAEGTPIHFQIVEGEDNTLKAVNSIIESIDSDGNMILTDGKNKYKCVWETTLVGSENYKIEGYESTKCIVLDNGTTIKLNDMVMMIDKETQSCISLYTVNSICGNVVLLESIDDHYKQFNVDEWDESKYELVSPRIPLPIYKDIMKICTRCVSVYPTYNMIMSKNGNRDLLSTGDKILTKSTAYGMDIDIFLTINKIGFIEGEPVIRFNECKSCIPLKNVEESIGCELSIELESYHMSYIPDYEKYDYWKRFGVDGYRIDKEITLKEGSHYTVTNLESEYLFDGVLDKLNINYDKLFLTFTISSGNKTTIILDIEEPNYHIFDNTTIGTLEDDEDDFE